MMLKKTTEDDMRAFDSLNGHGSWMRVLDYLEANKKQLHLDAMREIDDARLRQFQGALQVLDELIGHARNSTEFLNNIQMQRVQKAARGRR